MTSEASSQELSIGDVVDLDIGDVAHGGVFVARHGSGRVVFVPDVLPGERVRVRITDLRKKWARSEALDVLDASPERRAHVWPEASILRALEERVGGAEFGHATLPFQRELKRRVLADALRRSAGIDWDGEVEAVAGDDARNGTRWRTRVTLHVDDQGRVGPFAARSHRVVPVSSLPLAHADIEELALREIREGAASGPGRIEFIAPAEYDTRMRSILHGQHPRDAGVVRERVGEREFTVAEDGFWQVHRHAATTLSQLVREVLDADRFDASAANLDLYGGVGLFAAVLGDLGGPGTLMESVEQAAGATTLARENLAEWPNAQATTARVDQYLRGLTEVDDPAERAALRAGTVILDPPRAGAKSEVVDALATLAPAQLIYVACDPVALARDLALFAERGYRAEHIRAVDLFPNTHHLETIARITPAR